MFGGKFKFALLVRGAAERVVKDHSQNPLNTDQVARAILGLNGVDSDYKASNFRLDIHMRKLSPERLSEMTLLPLLWIESLFQRNLNESE